MDFNKVSGQLFACPGSFYKYALECFSFSNISENNPLPAVIINNFFNNRYWQIPSFEYPQIFNFGFKLIGFIREKKFYDLIFFITKNFGTKPLSDFFK